MARAEPSTLLALDRYAQIMGINPAHFNGGAGADIMILKNACADVWPQHTWQSPDRVSRDDLADAIREAEEDLARAVGYYAAPMWITKEVHRYPWQYVWGELDGGMNQESGHFKSLKLRWGKFIEAGQRAISLVGTATTAGGSLVYSDADGDGYSETATIVLPTTLTDECEIKVYFAGHAGDPAWEIRPARSKVIAGGNVTIVFWAWQLFSPALWETFTTTAGFSAIPITTPGSYVASVLVYREYTDFTEESAQFFWEPIGVPVLCICSECGGEGSGCPACNFTTQDGCIHVRDLDNGIVVPQVAAYSGDTGSWEPSSLSVCRAPDLVRIWYRAGDRSQENIAESNCDPLSNYWAKIIAELATARLSKPFCSCPAITARVQYIQADLSFAGTESHMISENDLDNPFGTRRGEVMAWRKIKGFIDRIPEVAVI